MVSVRNGLLIAMLASACLDPNPDFDGPADSGNDDAAGTADDAVAECNDDPFEPNDETESDIPLGTYTALLEGADAIDRYRVYIDPPAAVELFVTTDRDDVRACAFVRCEGSPSPAMVTCNVGLHGVSNGYVGCCSTGETALTYHCEEVMTAKIYVTIDQGPAACVSYDFEVGTKAL